MGFHYILIMVLILWPLDYMIQHVVLLFIFCCSAVCFVSFGKYSCLNYIVFIPRILNFIHVNCTALYHDIFIFYFLFFNLMLTDDIYYSAPLPPGSSLSNMWLIDIWGWINVSFLKLDFIVGERSYDFWARNFFMHLIYLCR